MVFKNLGNFFFQDSFVSSYQTAINEGPVLEIDNTFKARICISPLN